MPKVSWHLNLVSCFQEGILGFDCSLGQCFSRFLIVSLRSGRMENGGGGCGEEERYWIDRKSSNSHKPYWAFIAKITSYQR